jgi:hypothetical protein
MACGKNPQALLHRQRQIADRECCAHKSKFCFASIAGNDDLGISSGSAAPAGSL